MKSMSKAMRRLLQRATVVGYALILGGALVLCSSSPVGSKAFSKELNGTAARTCVDGVQESGALYRICVPQSWNGDLVVFAHGYIASNRPLIIPDLEVEGTDISEIINQLGYAFATTSYSKNGLAVKEGIADIVDLTAVFGRTHGRPRFTYLVGGSEGGVVATLAVEKFPQVFNGCLSACGPIGDFRRQIDYFGDFRVVFDYFFPDVLPPSSINIPQEVMDNWDGVYVPRIRDAINANPHATNQLLRVTRAPIDPDNPSSVESTVLGVLWYNVFATNDAIAELGGQSFDNRNRIYFGSDNDFRLNRGVQRFSADPAALAEIAANYQTSGRLSSQVVTLHTTGDPIVPYWHEPHYIFKVLTNRSISHLVHIPVIRHGHCNFTAQEVLASFAILVFKVSRENLPLTESLLPGGAPKRDLLRSTSKYRTVFRNTAEVLAID